MCLFLLCGNEFVVYLGFGGFVCRFRGGIVCLVVRFGIFDDEAKLILILYMFFINIIFIV
jgi:hypothetical protein